MRLDRAIVDAALARSRTEAQSLIAAGSVQVDGRVVTKASANVDSSSRLEVVGDVCPYVSRGGVKLAAALDGFGIDAQGCYCLDVGASTGGFTDCLLQRGAAHVDALDVGHGQMSPTLLDDPRVTLQEGVNARLLQPSDFERPFDLIVGDLSFISLTLVLPALAPLAHPEAHFVLLVKPQFEVGRSALGKGGIVRDPVKRAEAVERVVAAASAVGLQQRGLMTSPITGGDGNEEFLLWLRRTRDGANC